MGHLGGSRIFCCSQCNTFLTNREKLISTSFTGVTGRVYLFEKVVNIIYSDNHEKLMMTGRHIIRDVSCKSCKIKLGWMYEFATEEKQLYKEGKVILEKILIKEHDGIKEYNPPDAD